MKAYRDNEVFLKKNNMNIALIASGTGSNVKNIIEFFKKDKLIHVKAVISNKDTAGALQHAKKANIKTHIINQQELEEVYGLLGFFKEQNIDLIVLAGFLLKIPEELIQNFQGKIINVHPSLLPKYGGKGMYGKRVHEAVLNSGENKTGITIHYVNENYDEGKIIAQYSTAISENETMETLLLKIKELEKKYFPATIKQIAF